jgi:hypothetical protein
LLPFFPALLSSFICFSLYALLSSYLL